MLPELGQFCLILALGLAGLQVGMFFVKQLSSINVMRPIALGQAFFVSIAFVILWWAFVSDDFTLPYVAMNSNSNLALYYKFTAIWGAHEGSLLLWILILNLWVLSVALLCRNLTLKFANAVFAVFATVNIGFLAILLWISNPFLRDFNNVPLDGMDLNPMLQDFGMIIHPPILYAGYVGSTLAFAFAIAALIEEKIDRTWAQIVQPWVLLAWLFLTLGIALGSWWAYYELGWGGWWFWDPVENASFMPWLTSTALVHCLAVARKTGKLLGMALFLAIATFALSLLGTFLVRSGVIVSVHAFVTDPQRGLFILQFFALLLGGAMVLYFTRLTKLSIQTTALHKSEIIILSNNIILLVATGTILLGTLYPLIYDAIYQKQIAVGYPYFNAVFVPIMCILFAVMLPGLINTRKSLLKALLVSLILALAFLYLWFGAIKPTAVLGLFIALAIMITCWPLKNLSMSVAHLGLAVSIIGISLTPAYEIEIDTHMRIGENMQIAGYDIEFTNIADVVGANYVAFVGDFVVSKNTKIITALHPEKRTYTAREVSMTETAILPGLLQDLYISLGQKYSADTWSVRIYFKPFVRWIWLGAIIMAVGAGYGIFCCKFPKYKRLKNTKTTLDLVASV